MLVEPRHRVGTLGILANDETRTIFDFYLNFCSSTLSNLALPGLKNYAFLLLL